jgi:putative ABC transport system permease protein
MPRLFFQDLRHAVQTFARTPGFTLVAILTIALGLGANTAIFSVLHATLLAPLPYAGADRLVLVSAELRASGLRNVGVGMPELERYRREPDLFDGIFGIYRINANLTGETVEPERIEGVLASPEYFRVLGVTAARGRLFDERDAHPGIAGVAVISHRLWTRRFGGQDDAIGRRIRLDGDIFEIIGVLPATFRHPGRGLAGDPDLFAPAGFAAAPFPRPQVGLFLLDGAIARLRSDVSIDAARERLASVGDGLRREHPDALGADRDWHPTVIPLRDALVGEFRAPMALVTAAVAGVLLIACTNVAGLLVARNAARAREFAVRRALGASVGRLARQLLTESLALSSAGALAGLLVAGWLLLAVRALAPADVAAVAGATLDTPVLAFTAALAIVTGLAFGLWPVIAARHVPALDALHAGSRTVSAGRRAGRARNVLVITQVALAVLLVASAGLLLRSFGRLMAVDPGFSPERVLAARLWMPKPNDPSSGPYATHEARVALLDRVQARVRALPGVQNAGWVNWLPLGGEQRSTRLFIEGGTGPQATVDLAEHFFVSDTYFETMEVSPLRGRLLRREDVDGTPLVLVVSERFARRYFPDGRAVGRRVRVDLGPGISTPWQEIVGVVPDVRSQRLDAGPAPQVYRSIWQRSDLSVVLMVRAKGDPAALGDEIRAAVWSVDPDLPLFSVQPMTEVLASTLGPRRFSVALVGGFAALALALACVGIYSVVAFLVEQRTAEIGLRVALGATAGGILRWILRRGLLLAMTGVVIGLVAAAAAGRAMAAQLFEISPLDPLTFVLVAIALLAAAAAACLVPALRAARLDPVAAIRRG